MKHKHYDCIVAWADGAEIEYKSPFGWQTAQSPAWTPCDEYRIKPEVKQPVVRWNWAFNANREQWSQSNYFYTEIEANKYFGICPHFKLEYTRTEFPE